jgi:hypothetical protein
MPAQAGISYLDVLPDTRMLGPAMRREIPRAIGRQGAKIPITPDAKNFRGKLASGVMPGVKSVVASIGGLMAAEKIFSFVTESVAAARESNAIGRQTEAVIRSTGGAAKVTASQVGDLATAISNKTGKDDEAIQSGANFLLQFTNVRNETGKGRDIFNQAAASAVDLAASLHHGEVTAGGMKGASALLGKALNDPVKGMTALRKVGVVFTASQQDQIKTMVKSGNVLGAQQIIMEEVRKRTAGAAEASSTAAQKLGVRWGNLQESAGNLLIPVIDKLSVVMGGLLTISQKHPRVFGMIAAAIGAVAAIVVVNSAATRVMTGVQGVAKAATIGWAAAQKILNFVLAANPIGLVIAAIALLAVGLIYAYKHSETFRKIVDGAFRGVAAAGKAMWEHVLRPVFGFLVRTWLTVAGSIINGAAKAFGWVPGLGPKLKRAADVFNNFAVSVNRSLQNKIDDKTVKVQANFGWTNKTYSVPGSKIRMQRKGGRLPGYGGGDILPVMAEPGEAFIDKVTTRQHAAELAAWGVPGFRAGGVVVRPGTSRGDIGTGIGKVNQATTRLLTNFQTIADRISAAAVLTGGSGAGFGSGSWMRAINALHHKGVPFSIISTFRPGAVTHASGRQSYHALNRAVDLDGGHNKLRIFNALTDTGPTELIYAGAPVYKSRRGWNPIGELDRITYRDHIYHVHAAYRRGGLVKQVADRGGIVHPGLNLIENNLGRPEIIHDPRSGGIDYDRLAKAIAANPPRIYLDSQEVSRAVATGDLWNSRR